MRSKLITLIICLFSFAIVPVQAGSVTVTSSADSGPGSLREVLAAAIDGTTIQFAPALNGQTITLTSGELLIGANVTISGPPTSPIIVKRSTDTGTSAFRIFHITPGHTVTLSWLIITNGLAQGSPPDQSGGGIYNDGSIVTIENCQVDVNSAGNGGGIFSTAVNSGAAQLTINASNVDGNMATGDGGAIYNDGSGESHAASLVLIQSTTLTNTAQNGAGILNNGSSSGNADLVINDSLIAFNNATHQGGGILNFGQQNSGNTRATVSNSTLSQNRAENGGAILNDGQSGNARLDIATSTIAKNFVTQQGGSVYNTIGTNPLRSKGARKPDGSGPIAILTIKNTILDSIVNGAAENVFNDQGQVTSSGYNIISDDGGGFFSAPGDQTYTDPKLGLLQNNGGGIQTHALPGNSAAVNGGDPAFTPPPFYDQRGTGFDRVFGGRIDIGAFELQETAPPPARGTLINISTRLRILTADKSLIGGFIVAGTAPRRVLLRAIGPSLAGIIPDAIVDPVLELHGPAGFETIINDNWRDTQEAKIIATGIPPTNNFESAILATLPPGAYTAVMHGLDDGIGVGVVEAYDLDSTNDARLANISTRGFVDTGNNVMIGGFILGHGNLNAQILIRAIGPSLGKFGVPDVLADPTLELFNSNGFPVATNDNWRDTQEAEIEATGIPPTNDLESAIVRSLTPDAYTAIVRGVNESVGVGLVEVYQLVPPPTPTPTATPELTPSPTPEPSPTPKETPTPTPTPTETPTPVPTETPSPTPDKSPVAFSVYSSSARVGTGDAISMNAALVTGPGARRIIVRGLGPSLPTPAPLADPALELRGNSILIRANDNWRSDQEAEITDTGFAPTNDLEAAMVETIPAGSYTVVLRGVINGTGFGANDLHDLSGSDPGSISAIGTRAQVLTGNEILASGIQVENGGDMLIRALGPSLSSAGIATVLADPTIQLRDSNGDPVVDNDNWRDDPKQEALIIATGLAPSDNLESAIFVSLLPGTYTTLVQGNAGGTGIGYVQFYSLPHTGAALPLVP